MQAAQLALCPGDGLLHLRLLPHVAVQRMQALLLLARQRVAQLLDALLASRQPNNNKSGLKQRLGAGSSDASAGAAHDGNFVAPTFHAGERLSE